MADFLEFLEEDRNKELLKLSKLDDADFNKLLNILRQIKVGGSLQDNKEILSQFQEHSSIINVLVFSFYYSGEDSKEYLSQLFRQYNRIAGNDQEKLDEDSFKKKFQNFLDATKNLKYTFKAKDLRVNHTKILNSARIFTDIRPIFSTNTDEEIIGTVIVHHLKISYQENKETKETFLSLDKQDIVELKKILERAEKKQEVIEKSLNKIDELKYLL